MDDEGRTLVKSDNEDMTPYTLGRLRQCFFLASAAVFKLINIFYGELFMKFETKNTRRYSDLRFSTQ